MNKIQLTLLLLFSIGSTLTAQNVKVIPQPLQVKLSNGQFVINSKTKIVNFDKAENNARFLQNMLKPAFGEELVILNKGTEGIILDVNEEIRQLVGDEGYQLQINNNSISIIGADSKGVFYGLQTLRQLMPVDLVGLNEISIQNVSISDKPRFSWRAYMLDEARYFHGAEFVKKILDEMALLKMNIFHWHLVDDAGWRIEIKKYPKLTSVGGFRKDSQIGPKKWKSTQFSGESHGGFYTQEEIKDIVSYATERHITVVPEIEMPGHASASIAAYPWIGTDKQQIEVPSKFGRFRDIYDVSDPKVIQFLHDVLEEVFTLFPSKVIHIGGDEVAYDAWRESEHVKKFMMEKQLNTPADLQVYFTNNISSFIESKGRRMMGWNEIMGINVHHDQIEKKNDEAAKTALAKNVIVHFWKGNIDLINTAAEKGYSIVNSLHSSTYLDYNYKSISLQNAYEFSPIPKGLKKEYEKNIYGLGTQMWSEWTPTNKDVEFQTFPRLAAYAAVGWTSKDRKDYNVFHSNLNFFFEHWKNKEINFSTEF